jgi:hypothetical protein
MGDWNAAGGGHSHAGGDARYGLTFDTRLPQRQHFLATTAKHERITALYAGDHIASSRQAQHQPLDKGLWCRTASAALANLKHARRRRHMHKHGPTHQIVNKDHIGRGQRAHGFKGQKFRIARPRADQEYPTTTLDAISTRHVHEDYSWVLPAPFGRDQSGKR